MQLTTIALATILLSSVATAGPKKPKNISSSLKTRMAAFETLGEEQPEGPSKKQEHSLAGSRSSASATKPKPTPGPSVRIFPPPTPKTEKESEKPTPSSAKKPAAIFRTAPPSSSTVSPASTPTPPKPFAKPTPPASFPGAKVDPRSGEKSHASKVAGLREQWESASEPTPAPKPSTKTRSVPSAKATGIGAKPTPGPAKKSTTHTGPTPSSRTPPASKPTEKPLEAPLFLRTGEKLVTPDTLRKQRESQSLSAQPTVEVPKATATVSRVAGLAKEFESTSQPATDISSTSPEELLKIIGTGDKGNVLSTLEKALNLPPGSLVEVLKGIPKENQEELFKGAAVAMFESGKPEHFAGLVTELQSKGALDKDSANFAFNCAFVAACAAKNLDLAQKFYRSAKIFSSMYASAISASFNEERPDVFNWLLSMAGRDDLIELVQASESPEGVTEALEKALEVARFKFRTQELA